MLIEREKQMDNRVYGVQCPDYSQVFTRMTQLLNMMGGMDRYAKQDERLALKVNLLSAAHPDKAVSTHPAVVAAVASLTRQQGAKPLIVDSPGSGYRYNPKVLNRTYQITGIRQAAETAGVEVNLDYSHKEVPFPQGS
jgi:uncharacterized protein (DUF362 family)